MGGRTTLYLSGENFDNQEGGGTNKKEKGLFYNIKNTPLVNKSKNYELIEESLNLTINDLYTNNIKTILIYPIPEVGWNVSKKIITRLALSGDGLKGVFENNPLTTSYKAFLKRSKNIYKIYNSIDYKNIIRIYPEKILCNSLIKDRCITHNKSKVFYIDDDHLSYDGAKLIVNEIKNALLD